MQFIPIKEAYITERLFSLIILVEVINPKITVRTWNDRSEQFRPMVTSPYTLTLNDKSTLNHHNGSPDLYIPLLRFPTKPVAGYFPLRNIHSSGASMKGMLWLD